jgi:hypothetical protein
MRARNGAWHSPELLGKVAAAQRGCAGGSDSQPKASQGCY